MRQAAVGSAHDFTFVDRQAERATKLSALIARGG